MALETTVGRTRKHGDEETETVTVRAPVSLKAYLAKVGPSAGMAAYEILMFERELAGMLEEVLPDLRLSAALQNTEYSQARAETIARLVRLGLKAEKKR